MGVRIPQVALQTPARHALESVPIRIASEHEVTPQEMLVLRIQLSLCV